MNLFKKNELLALNFFSNFVNFSQMCALLFKIDELFSTLVNFFLTSELMNLHRNLPCIIFPSYFNLTLSYVLQNLLVQKSAKRHFLKLTVQERLRQFSSLLHYYKKVQLFFFPHRPHRSLDL